LKALEADGTYKSILTKWKTEGGAITDFAVNPKTRDMTSTAVDRPGVIHARPVRHPGRWVGSGDHRGPRRDAHQFTGDQRALGLRATRSRS
jgi:hypothetical protein